MLDSTLLRVSKEYRDGYRDGEKVADVHIPGEVLGFGRYDYAKGYDAGLNDAFWKKFRDVNGIQCWPESVRRWSLIQKRIYLMTPQATHRSSGAEA